MVRVGIIFGDSELLAEWLSSGELAQGLSLGADGDKIKLLAKLYPNYRYD